MLKPRFFDPGPEPPHEQRTEQEATAEALEALFDQVALIGKAAEAATAGCNPRRATARAAAAAAASSSSSPRVSFADNASLYNGGCGAGAAFNHVQAAFACASPGLRALVARREREEREKREKAQPKKQQRPRPRPRPADPESPAVTRPAAEGGDEPAWGQLSDGQNPEGHPASWESGALSRGAREIGRRYYYRELERARAGDFQELRARELSSPRRHALLSDDTSGHLSTAEEGVFLLKSFSEFERRFFPERGVDAGGGGGGGGEVRLRVPAERLLSDRGVDSQMNFCPSTVTPSVTLSLAQISMGVSPRTGLPPAGEITDFLYGRSGEVAACCESDRILRRFVVDLSSPSSPSSSSSPSSHELWPFVSELMLGHKMLPHAADVLCESLLVAGRRNFAAAQQQPEGSATATAAAAAADDDGFGLLFSWHGKRYLGAAHGLCGVLHVLASAAAAFGGDGGLPSSRRAGLARALEWGVGFLLENVDDETGNLRTAPASQKDELVQWCHGSPGLLLLEAALEDMHRDRRRSGSEALQQRRSGCVALGEQPAPPLDLCVSAATAAALRAATTRAVGDIARRGFLTKGLGLCHGLSGNGYALLSYARTRRLARLRGAEGAGDSERDAAAALALARRFRDVVAARWREFAEVSDKATAGLYTGMAGSVCFLADTVLREGGVCGAMEMNARMPGYCFW